MQQYKYVIQYEKLGEGDYYLKTHNCVFSNTLSAEMGCLHLISNLCMRKYKKDSELVFVPEKIECGDEIRNFYIKEWLYVTEDDY